MLTPNFLKVDFPREFMSNAKSDQNELRGNMKEFTTVLQAKNECPNCQQTREGESICLFVSFFYFWANCQKAKTAKVLVL